MTGRLWQALATLEVFQILVQNHLRVECAMVRSPQDPVGTQWEAGTVGARGDLWRPGFCGLGTFLKINPDFWGYLSWRHPFFCNLNQTFLDIFEPFHAAIAEFG
jgi:hypothetical protein